jgi:hypothetical protein
MVESGVFGSQLFGQTQAVQPSQVRHGPILIPGATPRISNSAGTGDFSIQLLDAHFTTSCRRRALNGTLMWRPTDFVVDIGGEKHPMHGVKLLCGLWAWAFFVLTMSSARAEPATTSGELVIDAPTLTAIGVEWKITGDDNTNAAVEVRYRRRGEQIWLKALPLLRIHHEVINSAEPAFRPIEPTASNPSGMRENPWHYDTGNMFAGSVLNLLPDTDYECRFTLSDPDGVKGEQEKTITVRTRKEPQPAVGGHIYHVYPIGWKGPMQQPAFTGLMRAYNMGSSASDHDHTFPPRVQPGDTILVHAGLYVSDRFHYMNGLPHPGYNALAAVTDGTYYLTQSGTPEKPVVIRAAGDGEVIFDGAGAENLFNLLHANYNYFEGITVRNTTVAFLLGWKDIAGSSGFTLKRSRIYDVARAVEAEWSGSRDFYIADNVIVGRHEPTKMMSWTGAIWENYPSFPESLQSEYGIKVYGQGHVVTHNYVANFHDAIDVSTYGEPDGTPDIASDKLSGPTEMNDREASSIDFYRNDIYNMGDNCIEGDGGAHNIRIFENRCFNSAAASLSAQPIFGGPIYFYRNLVYNSPSGGPLKFADTPAGVLVYQNTFVAGDTSPGGPVANAHLINNLFLGRGASNAVYAIETTTNYSTSDYNGFGSNKGDYDFAWNSPPADVIADYDYTHKLSVRRFKTLKEFGNATGQDRHSIMVNYDVFVNVPRPDRSDPQRLYNPEDMDFRLRPHTPAIDAGALLPTINDEYTGKAPDLGAYEFGRPVPDYGPRTLPPGMAEGESVGFRSWTGPPRADLHLLPK